MSADRLTISLWFTDRKDQPGPILVNEDLLWGDLRAMIRTMYEDKPADIQVKIIDNEEDEVSINSQCEWMEAIRIAKQTGSLIRMHVRQIAAVESVPMMKLTEAMNRVDLGPAVPKAEAAETCEESGEGTQNLECSQEWNRLVDLAQTTAKQVVDGAVNAIRDAESGEKSNQVEASPDFFGFIGKDTHNSVTRAITLTPADREKLTQYGKALCDMGTVEAFLTTETQENIHEKIRCDVCKTIIKGVRYMCGNCADFDLCEKCEEIPTVHNINHVFLKLRRPCFNAGMKDGKKVALLKRVMYNDENKHVPSCRHGRLREDIQNKLEKVHRRSEDKAERKSERAARLYEKIRRAEEKIERERRTEEKLKRKLERMETQRDLPQKKEKVELGFQKDFHDAELIRNVTIPDNTLVQPGTRLKKTWRMKNTGTKRWKNSTQLRMMFGSMRGEKTEFPVPFLNPQEEGDVTVDVIAPQTPGKHTCQFQLNDKGENFGPRLTCVVEVEPRHVLEPVAAKEKLKVVEEENGEEEKAALLAVPIAERPELVEAESDMVEEVRQQMTRHLVLGLQQVETTSNTSNPTFCFIPISELNPPKKSQTATPNNTPLDISPPKSPIPEVVDIGEIQSSTSSVEVVSEDGSPECDHFLIGDSPSHRLSYSHDYHDDDIFSLSTCSDSEDDFVFVFPDCFDVSKPVSAKVTEAQSNETPLVYESVGLDKESSECQSLPALYPEQSLPEIVDLEEDYSTLEPEGQEMYLEAVAPVIIDVSEDGPWQGSFLAPEVPETEFCPVASPESCAQGAPLFSFVNASPQESLEAATSQNTCANEPVPSANEEVDGAASADQTEVETEASEGLAEDPQPAAAALREESPHREPSFKAEEPGGGAEDTSLLFTPASIKMVVASAASHVYSTCREVFTHLQGRGDMDQNSGSWVPKSGYTPPTSDYKPPQHSWEAREPSSPMERLISMGFGNRALNQHLLEKHGGDLQRVIEDLVDNMEKDWPEHRH